MSEPKKLGQHTKALIAQQVMRQDRTVTVQRVLGLLNILESLGYRVVHKDSGNSPAF